MLGRFSALGEYDAIVECNELAILEFLDRIDEDNVRHVIDTLSAKHGVRVDSINIILFKKRTRQHYISSVSQQFEQFLGDLKREWLEYFPDSEWSDRLKGETLLDNAARNMDIALDQSLIDIADYYRLVRNFCLHADRNQTYIEDFHKSLMHTDLGYLDSMNLSLTPNSLEKICFDDFIIFTNVVKHVAYRMCIESKPNNSTIARHLFTLLRGSELSAYKGIKKLKNNDERYENAIRQFSYTHCGRLSRKDLEEVVASLKCLLA